jgi:hypothetical protein
MTCHIDIGRHSDHLEVLATGHPSYANSLELWRQVAEACRSHNCFNILGEGRHPQPMTTLDAWKHQSIFNEVGISAKFLIAWIDTSPQNFAQIEFIRSVLANRDMASGKLFTDRDTARAWLLKTIARRKLAQSRTSPR